MTDALLKESDRVPDPMAAELAEFRNRTGKTWKTVADELATLGFKYSDHTLRLWANQGYYDYDEPLVDAVKQYKKLKGADWYPPKTLSGKRFDTEVRYYMKKSLAAAREGCIEILTGPSGVGKTLTYLDKKIKFANAHRNIGAKEMVKKIAEQLDVIVERGNTTKIMDAIAARLVREPGVIIIDEASYLSVDCIDMVRYIFDEADRRRPGCCGVVMTGTEKLRYTIENTRARGTGRSDLEQFASRVDHYVMLPGFDEDKVRDLVEEKIGKVSDAVAAEIRSLVGPLPTKQAPGMANARRINKLLNNLKRFINNGKTLDVDLVQKAAAFLLG